MKARNRRWYENNKKQLASSQSVHRPSILSRVRRDHKQNRNRGWPWEKTKGASHSTQNFEISETGSNGSEMFWEKFQKIRKLLNFRKANHSTKNSGKFRDESQMERKFPEKSRKFGYTSRGYPLFRHLCKFQIFYSALASSFGRDHSELDISLKDDGDAHSIKKTF